MASNLVSKPIVRRLKPYEFAPGADLTKLAGVQIGLSRDEQAHVQLRGSSDKNYQT